MFRTLIFFFLISSIVRAGKLVPTEVLISEATSKAVLRSGGVVGVGGDVIDERKLSAWFYGGQPIITCYARSKKFGLSDQQVEQSIKRVIRKWQDYFVSKNLDKISSKNKINVNYAFKGKCKGEEDLRLYFGTGPIFGNLRDLKAAQTLSSPVAYINKTYINRDLKWSRGYIRLVDQGYYFAEKNPLPNWKKKGALDEVLLHEFGHVKGFKHSRNTIMASSIIDEVFLKEKKPKFKIDHDEELLGCSGCAQKFSMISISEKGESILGFSSKEKPQLIVKDKKVSLSNGKKVNDIAVKQILRTDLEDNLVSNFSIEDYKTPSYIQTALGFLGSKKQRQPVILVGKKEGRHRLVELMAPEKDGYVSLGKFRKVIQ